MSLEESAEVRLREPSKIMESRSVLTAKRLESQDIEDAKQGQLLLDWDTGEPCKAKARHVMKGFSEEGAENLEAATPQVTREASLLVTQLVASHRWKLGFMDFTQAFHSGDKIDRIIYAEQPREGVPGMKPGQLIRLLKTCYGLSDGPLAWYKHLRRQLVDVLHYKQSLADPCVFYQHGPSGQLSGVIAVATDDLLHGGDDQHLANMHYLQKKYKMGKFQFGSGRFCGKNFTTQPDSSITVDQEHYTKEKLMTIELSRARKKQRYNFCDADEVSKLRASVGALSWLSKETRPDLAGKVALLQQCFPHPRIRDLLEANAITKEAMSYAGSGIRIMPIPPEHLRVGVASDASWGNAREHQTEAESDDVWEETSTHWIRRHRSPIRTFFHPGMIHGPDLHSLSGRRSTYVDGTAEPIEDTWTTSAATRTLRDQPWQGSTWFEKIAAGSVLEHGKISEAFLQLMSCSSQGGFLTLFFDRRLETEACPHMVSITAWKSTRLKRKTVNTLSAECQSLIHGMGNLHWHRYLLLEILGTPMNDQEWESRLAAISYVAVVDSKSLFDCVNKLVCTYAQIDDKRTAIDIAILKDDLNHTGGHVRWVAGTNMLADVLTKRMNGDFLRRVCNHGYWTLNSSGHDQLIRDHELLCIQM